MSATAFPLPADDEMDDLRARLRKNLARVAKKGKECKSGGPDSKLLRLKDKMTKMAAPASRFAKYVEEAEEDDARGEAKDNGAGLRPTKVLTPPPGPLGCPVVAPDDERDPRADS